MFKNIQDKYFNTVLNVYPVFPDNKSLKPIVDYTKFFQTYKLLED
jgi:hypothetical protein